MRDTLATLLKRVERLEAGVGVNGGEGKSVI